MKKEFIYISVIAILLTLCFSLNQKSKNTSKLYNSALNETTSSRNALGQQVAVNSILQGSIKDLKDIHAKDSSQISELQKIVNRKTISATVISGYTVDTINERTIITLTDTVYSDSAIYIYPTYTLNRVTKWDSIVSVANKDTFSLEYKIFNNFQIKQEFKRNGLFKPKTPMVEVVSLNPNTITTGVKTFTLKSNKSEKRSSFIIGLISGAGTIIGLNYIMR